MLFSRQRYLDKLIAHKHNHQIKVITGIRRSGKSFLLFNIFHNHLIECGISNDHIIKIDLEDRRNKSLRDPDALLTYIDNCMHDNEMYYILLDEVQLVNEFEDVLNSYLKIPNADIYVTGSNSKFLSKDIITNFRGRGDEIHVYPLSLKEICETQPDVSWQRAWEMYLHYGGLPFCVLLPNDQERIDYLKKLFTETYLKDTGMKTKCARG
ncbi:MAG: AAA family ATPase [Muribaculaceae bacterium]|nr:AAA family ATPase [Muribaculaceae bacterium]